MGLFSSKKSITQVTEQTNVENISLADIDDSIALAGIRDSEISINVGDQGAFDLAEGVVVEGFDLIGDAFVENIDLTRDVLDLVDASSDRVAIALAAGNAEAFSFGDSALDFADRSQVEAFAFGVDALDSVRDSAADALSFGGEVLEAARDSGSDALDFAADTNNQAFELVRGSGEDAFAFARDAGDDAFAFSRTTNQASLDFIDDLSSRSLDVVDDISDRSLRTVGELGDRFSEFASEQSTELRNVIGDIQARESLNTDARLGDIAKVAVIAVGVVGAGAVIIAVFKKG